MTEHYWNGYYDDSKAQKIDGEIPNVKGAPPSKAIFLQSKKKPIPKPHAPAKKRPPIELGSFFFPKPKPSPKQEKPTTNTESANVNNEQHTTADSKGQELQDSKTKSSAENKNEKPKWAHLDPQDPHSKTRNTAIESAKTNSTKDKNAKPTDSKKSQGWPHLPDKADTNKITHPSNSTVGSRNQPNSVLSCKESAKTNSEHSVETQHKRDSSGNVPKHHAESNCNNDNVSDTILLQAHSKPKKREGSFANSIHSKGREGSFSSSLHSKGRVGDGGSFVMVLPRRDKSFQDKISTKELKAHRKVTLHSDTSKAVNNVKLNGFRNQLMKNIYTKKSF